MTNPQYGILLFGDGHEDGTWMSEGWFQDEFSEWHPIPALYKTLREAKSDATLFQKDSKYKYIPTKYKEMS